MNDEAKAIAKVASDRRIADKAYSAQDLALKGTQQLILATPTGDKRDALFGAQTHMELAKVKLAEAMKL